MNESEMGRAIQQVSEELNRSPHQLRGFEEAIDPSSEDIEIAYLRELEETLFQTGERAIWPRVENGLAEAAYEALGISGFGASLLDLDGEIAGATAALESFSDSYSDWSFSNTTLDLDSYLEEAQGNPNVHETKFQQSQNVEQFGQATLVLTTLSEEIRLAIRCKTVTINFENPVYTDLESPVAWLNILLCSDELLPREADRYIPKWLVFQNDKHTMILELFHGQFNFKNHLANGEWHHDIVADPTPRGAATMLLDSPDKIMCPLEWLNEVDLEGPEYKNVGRV